MLLPFSVIGLAACSLGNVEGSENTLKMLRVKLETDARHASVIKPLKQTDQREIDTIPTSLVDL
ncbi:hypothetical protein [Paenibacillus xylanexedens]|uniref:hypothetical protein n=1 Tax=Paenibacillus xylanexedens TaxID=528191 RepID=UPI000F5320D7|nr:hypothetical protein [Paenibacillus xylanexedens]